LDSIDPRTVESIQEKVRGIGRTRAGVNRLAALGRAGGVAGASLGVAAIISDLSNTPAKELPRAIQGEIGATIGSAIGGSLGTLAGAIYPPLMVPGAMPGSIVGGEIGRSVASAVHDLVMPETDLVRYPDGSMLDMKKKQLWWGPGPKY